MKTDEVIEKDDTYRCDSCRLTFAGSEVVLKPATTGIKFGPGWSMIVVDSEGAVRDTQNFKDGDQTLACPRCGHDHLKGFDRVADHINEVLKKHREIWEDPEEHV